MSSCNCKITPRSAIVGDLNRSIRTDEDTEYYTTYAFAFIVILALFLFYTSIKKK